MTVSEVHADFTAGLERVLMILWRFDEIVSHFDERADA